MNRTRVLLLRDLPEQRLRSMERYADAIERGFARDAHFEMRSMAPRLGALRSGHLARFVAYPLAVARQRADVFHIIDQGYAHVAQFAPRDRTVVTCHDLMLLKAAAGCAGFRPRRLALARFHWSTTFLRKVALVVCDSEATRADVIRLRRAAPDRTMVVPPGVDERFRPLPEARRAELRARLLGNADRRMLLHVSTGDRYKNVEGTLRVVAALRNSGVDITLVRAGRTLTEAQGHLAGALSSSDAVIDCGRVSDERLVELYNAADVLVFPSHAEGFGWPPLEAMSCATPVVASDCEALRETVGGAGLLAPATDDAALAAAVRRVVEDSELADRLRQRGLQRASDFTWKRAVAGLSRAYARVAEEAERTAFERSGSPACAE